ncbi:MAG: pyridoxal-phosphate dependent enzyme, partial [Myxococcota bacterium]
MNTTRASVVDAIGNTPLIKLRGPSEATGCTILGKAEWLNPGMSVKDRAAKFMVLDAEQRGLLTPGSGTIVEGTAGNTGIGLALVGRARGYRVIIVIPETQTDEKKQMLRLFGAELVQVPAPPRCPPPKKRKWAPPGPPHPQPRGGPAHRVNTTNPPPPNT